MKEIKLIKAEIIPILAWPMKLIAVAVGLYFLNDIYIDILNEYVVRRGSTYTLEDSPIGFYLNIAKRGLFSIIAFYFALWGIKLKKGNDES